MLEHIYIYTYQIIYDIYDQVEALRKRLRQLDWTL